MEISVGSGNESTVLEFSGQGTVEYGSLVIEKLRGSLDKEKIRLDLSRVESYDLTFLQILYSFINTFVGRDHKQLTIRDSGDKTLQQHWREYGLDPNLLHRFLKEG